MCSIILHNKRTDRTVILCLFSVTFLEDGAYICVLPTSGISPRCKLLSKMNLRIDENSSALTSRAGVLVHQGQELCVYWDFVEVSSHILLWLWTLPLVGTESFHLFGCWFSQHKLEGIVGSEGRPLFCCGSLHNYLCLCEWRYQHFQIVYFWCKTEIFGCISAVSLHSTHKVI